MNLPADLTGRTVTVNIDGQIHVATVARDWSTRGEYYRNSLSRHLRVILDDGTDTLVWPADIRSYDGPSDGGH